MHRSIYILIIFFFLSCAGNNKTKHILHAKDTEIVIENSEIIPGAENTELYLAAIQNKRVALVTNQTGIIKNELLADTLLAVGINITKIFCPEHGFRGTADAGEIVDDNIDEKTGIKIYSLYGANRKPKKNQMQDLDIVVFDLQDVGVRFYTYISTLHYVMETCAENNIPLIVLDRPNPNAHYIDGPVLDTSKFKSFIGMHPVPVVYGMTIGEYAQMINGEKWLLGGIQCDLTIIPISNYSHNYFYSLPVKPSPNLPNDRSIELYPSVCFFEGTNLSLGRGTDKQFQVIGHPDLKNIDFADYSFTPMPNIGAQNPVLNGIKCYGFDLSKNNSIFSDYDKNKLNISIIIKVYEIFPNKENFFLKNNFFNLLAGNDQLKFQIKNSIPEDDIRKSWDQGIAEFKEIRSKYLIY